MTIYLSAPLALQASLGGDGTLSSIHEWLQSIDLVLVVDVDLKREVGPVASVWPGEGPAVAGEADEALVRRREAIGGEVRAGRKGAVKEAGEEEGAED